jgi:single-strand DNA-binding protein
MDDTTTTFIGRVATKVEGATLPGGAYKATFRIASGERRFDRVSGEWRDGRSMFMTVVAWRQLGEHAALSLAVGDPVIAHGRIFTREYEKDGRTQSVVEMEASALGPDLAWCTSTVSRKRAVATVAVAGGGLPAEPPEPAAGTAAWRGDGDAEDGELQEMDREIEREMKAHEAPVGV